MTERQQAYFSRAVFNTGDAVGGTGAPAGDGATATDPPEGPAPTSGDGGAGASGSQGAGVAGASITLATGGEDFYGGLGLDKDIADFIADKGHPDIGTALKSWREAQRVLRDRNSISLPEEGKEAEWDGWEKLGWVKDEAQYSIAAPDETGVQFDYNQPMWDVVRKVAHEQRVPLKAVQAMHDAVVAGLNEQAEQAGQDLQERDAAMMATLKEEWGSDFEKKEAEAKRVAAALGLDEDTAARLEGAIGDDAAIMRMFAGLYEKIGEDTLFAGEGDGGLATESSGSIARKQRALEESDEFKAAFYDERHPRHADMVARRQKLIDQKAVALERERRRST